MQFFFVQSLPETSDQVFLAFEGDNYYPFPLSS